MKINEFNVYEEVISKSNCVFISYYFVFLRHF